MALDTIFVAVISALFGAGGISAISRARGQNRADASSVLNSSQVAFNQALAQRVKDLEATDKARDESDAIRNAQYDEMIRLVARLGAENQIKDAKLEMKDETIARQVDQITTLGLKVDMLERHNTQLTARVATLERQIEGGHHVAS